MDNALFFIDIDIDFNLMLSDETTNHIRQTSIRTAMGIPGHIRYIFDIQQNADQMILLLDKQNILFQSSFRINGETEIKKYSAYA
jgi:hypothetical protein